MSNEKLIKTTGLVLRSIKLGESDRLVTLLSPDKGRLSVVAKGARKTKSKLSAAVDLFVYGDYVLYKGKNLYTATQCEVIESYPAIKGDFAAYAYATYFSELVNRVIVEDEKSHGVFSLISEVLRLIEPGTDFFILSRAFELKLLSVVGYQPVFAECINCGNERRRFFSSRMGGLICESCRINDDKAFPFSEGSLALAKFILLSPLGKAGLLKAGERQRKDLYAYNRGLLSYHLDIGECRSLKYITEHFES